MVCRWGGGNNAGHTIYLEGKNTKLISYPVVYFTEN